MISNFIENVLDQSLRFILLRSDYILQKILNFSFQFSKKIQFLKFSDDYGEEGDKIFFTISGCLIIKGARFFTNLSIF